MNYLDSKSKYEFSKSSKNIFNNFIAHQYFLLSEKINKISQNNK